MMLFTLVLIVIVPFVLIALLFRLQRIFQWGWLEKLLQKTDRLNERRRRRYIPVIEVLFIPVIVVLVYLSFRNIKPEHPRFDNRIAVVVDAADINYWGPVLSRQFERIVRTPQPEKQFQLVLFNDAKPSQLAGYNYQIVLASRASSPVRALISELPGGPADTAETEIRLIRRGDAVNGGRLVIAGWADSPDCLQVELERRGDELFAQIEEDAMTCRRGALFTSRKEAAVTRDLLERFGWSFTKFADMELVESSEDASFAAFSPFSPGRYLFVHWVENGDTALINPRWMIETRNRLCDQYYDSTYVDRHFFQPKRTTFLGRTALVTRGLWADDRPTSGGPFVNYLFYDPGDRRLYMIDVFVFRPGQDKLPFLQPLEVLAHTFITVREQP
ncbi:DUF4837 family protein [bacterium]|nr:DUF4837 family protein [bacterium]